MKMVYYASCCKESLEICYECHSVTCKHRGITRSIATQRIARTWTVRRVINASPDPTGLTCTFRNGIRGGSNRLAPRPVFARKNDDFSTKEEGQRRGLYGRLSVTRERKASCVTRVLSVVVPLRSDPLNLGCRGFFFSVPPTKREIGIHDYIINIHVTRRVPRQCCLYISAIVRLSICPRSRHNAHLRCVFVLVRSRLAGTISASTFTDIF